MIGYPWWGQTEDTIRTGVHLPVNQYRRRAQHEPGVPANASSQWFNSIRNVTEINNTETTEAIPVVSIPIDSVSSAYLVLKKNDMSVVVWDKVRPKFLIF